jgi:alkylated DNA nucleotide flippase Atl1
MLQELSEQQSEAILLRFLIPCHRVIQSTGKIGGYMWGSERKQLIIGWESSKFTLDFKHKLH